jgi:hypothetical protein
MEGQQCSNHLAKCFTISQSFIILCRFNQCNTHTTRGILLELTKEQSLKFQKIDFPDLKILVQVQSQIKGCHGNQIPSLCRWVHVQQERYSRKTKTILHVLRCHSGCIISPLVTELCRPCVRCFMSGEWRQSIWQKLKTIAWNLCN